MPPTSRLSHRWSVRSHTRLADILLLLIIIIIFIVIAITIIIIQTLNRMRQTRETALQQTRPRLSRAAAGGRHGRLEAGGVSGGGVAKGSEPIRGGSDSSATGSVPPTSRLSHRLSHQRERESESYRRVAIRGGSDSPADGNFGVSNAQRMKLQ